MPYQGTIVTGFESICSEVEVKIMRLHANVFLTTSLLMLAACASNIPRDIQDPPAGNPTINQVQQNIDRYTGTKVRWGGVIAEVENHENETWIEVVSQDLSYYGQPSDEDSSNGRFLVRIEGFIDPQIYAEGRELTIAGEVESRIVRPIDEYPYTYPLVRATAHHLWPERSAHDDYYLRYYHGYPFYPGYGFGYHYYPYGYW